MMKSPMILLTDEAADHLKTMIAAKNAIGFRLAIKPSGCSGFRYVPELLTEEIASDIKLQPQQGVVVYVAEDAVAAVEGTTVDFVAKDLGLKQMVFNNPHAENLCGCGESFSIKRDDNE